MGERADWSPQRYGRFAAERAQPFHDLLALVEPGARSAVDLGCGSGELTALAAERLGLERITGVDSSPAMLAAAAAHTSERVDFVAGDLAAWPSAGERVDLLIASASMQWVPDHAAVLGRWVTGLMPGGQLAVQVPDNAGAPTHVVARRVARRQPYLDAFGADGPPVDPVQAHVLAPEDYATILHRLGVLHQHVRLQVYPHLLPSVADAVEWVRGTALLRFERVLPAELYRRFVSEYADELLAEIGDHRPLFFPFRRILLWARLPAVGAPGAHLPGAARR